VTNIYNRFSDNNFSGVVISDQEKNEIIQFIEYYRPKVVSNSLNLEILDAIKEDVINITNRNSTQITNFLSQ
jgi:malic enzyme